MHQLNFTVKSFLFLLQFIEDRSHFLKTILIKSPLSGQTTGLCGTFSENQKDDFVTPDGDIEPSAVAFANKWRTKEYCADENENEPKHPCELNPQKRTDAEEYCSKIQTDIFSGICQNYYI